MLIWGSGGGKSQTAVEVLSRRPARERPCLGRGALPRDRPLPADQTPPASWDAAAGVLRGRHGGGGGVHRRGSAPAGAKR